MKTKLLSQFRSACSLSRLASLTAATVAILISTTDASAAIVIMPESVVEDAYNYSNFTYSNLGSGSTGLFATATVTGLNSTVQQSGSANTAGSARWFRGSGLTGSVTYTFDFSESGFTPDSLTLNTDRFRTFGGYSGSAATFTGSISVDGGESWTTIYTANVTGSTSSFGANIIPSSAISLTSLSGEAIISSVMYQFSYAVTSGSTAAFIGYNYVSYNDSLPGFDVSFAVTAIPEGATSAGIVGAAALFCVLVSRGRKRRT